MTTTRPTGGRSRLLGQPKGAGDPILLPLGKMHAEHGRLLIADARGQAILAGGDQLADDALHPFAGFPLAKDDFGKATPLTALKIDVGIAQVDLDWLIQARQSALDAQCPRAHLFEQLPQIAWFHDRPRYAVAG